MPNKREVVFAVGLLILVAIFYTYATWQYFTIPVPGGNDFLAHYSVWDLYLREGVNPYSDEAALHTQELIRGRPAEPGEDQNRLTYPFYSIFIHGPFALVDYTLARAIYMILLQGSIILGMILTLKLFEWQPKGWILLTLFAWSILNYPEARSVILGQFAPIGYLSLVASLFLIKLRKDFLAGVVLVVSTIKPTLIFLLVPFLLMWAIGRRRGKVVLGFGIVLSFVSAVSLLLLPSWIGDWTSRVLNYPYYTGGESPVWLLTHEYVPMLGNAGELTLTVALCISLLYIWVRFLKLDEDKEFYWTLGITILISNLIVPRSATTNYVMFLLPIVGFFAAFDWMRKYGWALNAVIMVLSVVGYWGLHAATIIGNREQSILFLPIPVILGLLLIFGRSIFIHNAERSMAVG